MLCSLSVMGYSAATWTTSISSMASSKPPGARFSARTLPRTMTEDSWVRRSNSLNRGMSLSALKAVAWMRPVPSRTSRKRTLPEERLL